jgi:hypothetical protein
MFSYALIRAITGAAVMPGKNSAVLKSTWGAMAAVRRSGPVRAPGGEPGAGSAIFPDAVKT